MYSALRSALLLCVVVACAQGSALDSSHAFARTEDGALRAWNAEQRIEMDVFKAAVAIVDEMKALPSALVLANEEWHPGVVGIVATKLVERYDRATVLIGEGGRGSARTARGLHLYDALADVSHHLTKFGGHRAAAGLRIEHAPDILKGC